MSVGVFVLLPVLPCILPIEYAEGVLQNVCYIWYAAWPTQDLI